MRSERQLHGIAPVYDGKSKILILGSFPSVRSREVGFFYGHKQNRFWRVMAELFGEKEATTVEEKRALLLSHGIALWDVIASCEISGSSDASIKNAVPNDIGTILKETDIMHIYTNGATAHRLYCRYLAPTLGLEAIRLPSTSPANAAWTVEKLVDAWSVIRKEL